QPITPTDPTRPPPAPPRAARTQHETPALTRDDKTSGPPDDTHSTRFTRLRSPSSAICARVNRHMQGRSAHAMVAARAVTPHPHLQLQTLQTRVRDPPDCAPRLLKPLLYPLSYGGPASERSAGIAST